MSSKSKGIDRSRYAWRGLVLLCAAYLLCGLTGLALAAGTTWYGPGTFSQNGITTTTVSISGINRDLATDTAFLLTNAGTGHLITTMDKAILTYGGDSTGPVGIVPFESAAGLTGMNVYMWGPDTSDATAGRFEVEAPEGGANWAYALKAIAPFTVSMTGMGISDDRWLGQWNKGGAFFEDGSVALTQALVWPVLDDKQYSLPEVSAVDQYFNLHPQLISMDGVNGQSRFNTGHAFAFDAYDEAVAADWADIHPGLVDADLEGKMGRFFFTTNNISTGNVEKGLVTFSYEDGEPGIYFGDFSFGGDVTDPAEWTLPDVRLFREAANVLATDDLFKAYQVQTTVPTGTAPLVVASTTKVANLNADLLDGYNTGNGSGAIPISNGTVNTNLNADKLDGYHAGNGAGAVPISNGTVNTTLNADLLDGLSSADFAAADLSGYFKLDEDEAVTGRPDFGGAFSSILPAFTLSGTYATAKIINLNADLLDGHSEAYFLNTGSTLDADTLDTHDSTYFINGTDTDQDMLGGLTLTYSGSDVGRLILDNDTSSIYYLPATIEMLGTGHGLASGADGLLISSGNYTGSVYTNAKLWNYEDSDVEIGANNKKGLTVSDTGLVIGSNTDGVDYDLLFDGFTSEGTITFDEDNSEFRFDQEIYLPIVSAGVDETLLTLQNRDNTVGTAASLAFVTYAGETETARVTGKRVASGIYGLSFSTYQNADTMVIREGNVGIGDTTPDYLLDIAGTFGIDSYFDIQPIAEPASPASGVRLYVDSTSGDLIAKNSAGTKVTVANF